MKRLKWLIILCLGTLLTACFGWGNKPVEEKTHYYVIDIDRGTVAAQFARNTVLRLKPVRVTSHFRSKHLMLRTGKNEYTPIKQQQFFSPPEEMMTEQLKRWLQKSGLFSEVIIDEHKPADYVLESAVTALYGEGRPQFSPQAVLEMQFFLLQGESGTSQVLFQTGLRTEVDIETLTAPELVKGWQSGFTTLMRTFEDDLSHYFAKTDP